MINRIFSLAVISLLLFAGTSLGSYDISATGRESVENLTMESFSALGIDLSEGDVLAEAGAPQAAASAAGTELGAYKEEAPRRSEIGRLVSTNIARNPPSYIYYDGSYIGWSAFTNAMPSGFAGMWIERSAGWSWYATLPLRSWARELLYVPTSSPVTLYEIYPSGSVSAYNLGSVQAGYYYIWFYADVPGRHRTVFSTNSGHSNTVVIDVYSVPAPYRPVRPTAKEQCERNPECDYVNGHCYCRGYIPENTEKQKCEQNPTCHYVNGQCFCTGFNPEPEPGPVPNPVAECEQNPLCHWANGQCLCTGFNPEPEPGPVPNPVAECEQNPTCHYVNGNCYCTGAGLGSTLDDGFEEFGESAETGETIGAATDETTGEAEATVGTTGETEATAGTTGEATDGASY